MSSGSLGVGHELGKSGLLNQLLQLLKLAVGMAILGSNCVRRALADSILQALGYQAQWSSWSKGVGQGYEASREGTRRVRTVARWSWVTTGLAWFWATARVRAAARVGDRIAASRRGRTSALTLLGDTRLTHIHRLWLYHSRALERTTWLRLGILRSSCSSW